MKKIIVLFVIVLFFIPSFIFGGEWIIHGQLTQKISDGARMVKLSQETCDLLGHDNLIWVGGGNAPGTGNATDYWAIYNMITGECLYEGNMLNPRGYFSVVEIIDNRLLIISGVNQNGTIADCEILNLPALIEISLTLSIPTDSVTYPASFTTAIVMNNNNVLYGGGLQSDGYRWQIYSVITETWGLVFYSQIGRHGLELELDPNSDNVIAIAGNPTYGEIEIFDSITTEWILGPEIPHPVYNAKTDIISDHEIALTGGSAWGEFFNQTILYDITSNTIAEVDTFDLGRDNHGSVFIEPLQSLFIGGGYTSISATKTCYSYHQTWTNEGELNRYQSWMNFFLTNDFHIFAIGNQYNGRLELYTWNYAPYVSEYTYSDGISANGNVVIADPNFNLVAVKFYFIEGADTTETQWTEYLVSGSSFEFQHTWNSATSSHIVICEMKDEHHPLGVHNSISDSTLVANVLVSDDEISTIACLSQNYPNPFNPITTINYEIKEASNVSLEIFNIKGQKVKTLVNEYLTADNYSIIWNGTDDFGKPVASGIYFYKMDSGKYISGKKMILMK